MVDFTRIRGLGIREPVGAVLRIGQKGPRGNPIDNDRFFFAVPQEDERRIRPLHPEFGGYHAANQTARTVIHGNLVHANEADAWHHQLAAQLLGKPHLPHPRGLPACRGDGDHAVRFIRMGEDGKEVWDNISCPNEKCEFRLEGNRVCKPFARLYFRPRWRKPGLPSPLTKWVTRSWNSAASLKGLFAYVRAQATALGLEAFSVYGLPFSMTLSKKSQGDRKRSFPVVSFAVEGDLVEYFLAQRRALIEAGGNVALLPGVRDDGEEVLAADLRDVTVAVPGEG